MNKIDTQKIKNEMVNLIVFGAIVMSITDGTRIAMVGGSPLITLGMVMLLFITLIGIATFKAGE